MGYLGVLCLSVYFRFSPFFISLGWKPEETAVSVSLKWRQEVVSDDHLARIGTMGTVSDLLLLLRNGVTSALTAEQQAEEENSKFVAKFVGTVTLSLVEGKRLLGARRLSLQEFYLSPDLPETVTPKLVDGIVVTKAMLEDLKSAAMRSLAKATSRS